MKIIDNKGKIFGRLNIVDFIIALFFIVFVAVIILFINNQIEFKDDYNETVRIQYLDLAHISHTEGIINDTWNNYTTTVWLGRTYIRTLENLTLNEKLIYNESMLIPPIDTQYQNFDEIWR